MWYKNLLRTDKGLKPQLVRVTEEIDKGIKHRRDIRIRHMACLCFPWEAYSRSLLLLGTFTQIMKSLRVV